MIDVIIQKLQDVLIDPFLQDPGWEIIAFVGQIIFGGRFFVQWLASEIKKQSHIPIVFWYLSIVGSVILWVYTIHKRTPVLTLAFSLQILIYLRNLQLIRKQRKANPGATTTSG